MQESYNMTNTQNDISADPAMPTVGLQDEAHGAVEVPQEATEANNVIDLEEILTREKKQSRRDDPLSGSDQNKLGDAHVSGPDSPEWQALLARPMTLLMPQNINKDAKQLKWRNSKPHTLRDWLTGVEGGSLSAHVERTAKGFYPLVFGADACPREKGLVRRSKDGMKTVEFVGQDYDSGDLYDDALKAVKAAGLACVGYTSFNHLTQRSTQKRSLVLNYLNIERDPTDAEMQAYLTHQDKLHPHIISTVKIEIQSEHIGADGVHIVFSHAKINKFRLMFPLAEVQTITELDPRSQKKSQDLYTAKVRVLAEKMGLKIDGACLDVSRVFYMPAHPPGAEYRIDVIRGRGLTLAELEVVETAPEVKTAKTGKPRVAGAAKPKTTTEGMIAGLSARKWAAKYAKRLQIGALLKEYAPEHVRREDDDGLLVVACPFDGEHNNSGDTTDTACHVRDADDKGSFVWECMHGCAERHDRLAMVAEAVKNKWFDESLLIDDEFLKPLSAAARAKEQAYTRGMDTDESRFEPVESWMPWELLSNLVFEACRSCGDLVWGCGFNSVFEPDAGDDFGEVVKAA